MRVIALQTGTVEFKDAFLRPATGLRRRTDLFTSRTWAPETFPIHAWVIEHQEHRILVDAGELADPSDPPFSRSHVTEADELPHALAAAGLDCGDLTSAVLTHMHPDHYRGIGHVDVPVTVPQEELDEITSRRGRIFQRIAKAPLPDADYRPVALDDGEFGAFAASRRLTPDGRVVLVATPGHTKHHTSVIAIADDGRHLLLAGDATDSLDQLRARRADPIAPDPAVQLDTIDRILAHERSHPMAYLPSHDRESAARLAATQPDHQRTEHAF